MTTMDNVKRVIMQKTGRPMAILSKHSPQILLGAGVVGVVAGTVLACKATLKVNDILDQTKETLVKIDETAESNLPEGEYTQEDVVKDKALVYTQTAMALGKLYFPAIAATTLGIGMILKSHNILNKRTIAMAAAYKVVSETFEAYRERVVEELGEDKDRQFRYGIVKEKTVEEVIGEDGKKKKVKGEKEIAMGLATSDYAKFFDPLSPRWSKIPEYNLMFLRSQEKYANDLLNIRGHVFLNEVYDMLGIPRTQPGTVVGWAKNNDERDGSDGYIDFGLYDLDDPNKRAFVNGYNDAILLDFNVDGFIADLI